MLILFIFDLMISISPAFSYFYSLNKLSFLCIWALYVYEQLIDEDKLYPWMRLFSAHAYVFEFQRTYQSFVLFTFDISDFGYYLAGVVSNRWTFEHYLIFLNRHLRTPEV